MENLVITGSVNRVQNEKDSRLRALANVQLGDVTISNIRVDEVDGKTIVNFPQYKSKNRDGEEEYRDLVSFDKKFNVINKESGKEYNTLKSTIAKTIKDIYATLSEEKTSGEINKETDFKYNKDLINASMHSTPNSENSKAAGAVLYGGILAINQVFLKDIKTKEAEEEKTVVNFKSYQKSDGEWKETVHPNNKEAREKMIEACEKSYEKSLDKEKDEVKEEKTAEEETEEEER